MQDDATRFRDVALQLLNEVGRRRELDVGVQVTDEPKREPLLIQIALEVEEEGLDLQLGAAERRAIPDGQRGDEVTLRRDDPTRVRSERRHQLVRLGADVRGRKAELPADLRAQLDRSTHLEFAPEQLVRRLHLTGGDQSPNL